MEGCFIAVCKEPTKFAAAFNGHTAIWPRCEVTLKDGWARFTRNGREVWSCNADYAAAHFILEKAPSA